MCRIGGTSMTGLEQRNSGAALSNARIAVSSLCWQVFVVLALITTSAQAAVVASNQEAGGDSSNSDGTSSRAARDEAVRAIPWKSMSPTGRKPTPWRER